MHSIRKYPRTPHLEGSRLQAGDEDLTQIQFTEIAGRHLVVEEKVDGANCGIGFDDRGRLRLQSRGHYLQGGPREKQFSLLKQWADQHQSTLYERLGYRYLMYGEWLYAKHTIFYNRLPHFFLEFDIFDSRDGQFLSTPKRKELLEGLPIHSTPVLHEGPVDEFSKVLNLLGPSRFIDADAKRDLIEMADSLGISAQAVTRESDLSGIMEGLYIKIEEDGRVVDRLKFVRADFLTIVDQSGSHWHDRPLIRNQRVGNS